MELFGHQEQAKIIAREHERYCFFWQCGTGKTIALLAICAERPLRTLVVAPKSILWAAWARDAEHFPGLKVVVAWHKNKAERLKLICDPEADVVVTNYDTFKRHFAVFTEAGFKRLVVDESSCLKNPKSQITKAAMVFADQMRGVYLLSGTPAPNNPTEYWGQMRTCYPNLFDRLYYRFAYKYFRPIKKWIPSLGKEVIESWVLRDSMTDEFHKKLQSRSWSLTKAEAVDLPEQTDQVREVALSSAERTAYGHMRDRLRVEFESGDMVGATGAGKLMKLRQITGGMMYGGGGEQYVVGESKLNELGATLEEIGADEPVVIWAEFRADIDRITGRLDGWGRPGWAVLDGRTGRPAGEIADFQAGKTRTLVCQPQAAGHGVTLTAACYAIYYSLSFSYETHVQSRDRIHRVGQTRPCTYVYLLAEGTCDGHLLDVLHRKATESEAVMAILGTEAPKDERSRCLA